MLDLGIQEYSFTIGILIAFLGLLAFAVLGRREIAEAVKSAGMKRKHLLLALLVVAIFLTAELAIVQPTQQIFFDDTIYQGMAVDLLHQGQAWFCDFGTPTACIIGEILHEPIGMPFNLAIGFAVSGVSINTAFAVGIALSAIGVFFTFLVAFMISRRPAVAFFSGLLMALSPLLLVWARPTTSDIAAFAYSIIAVFFLIVFIRKKNIMTFGMLAFALALSAYMKVDTIAMLPAALIIYLFLDGDSFKEVLRRNAHLIKASLLDNTRFLLVLLLFVIAVSPELFYSYNQFLYGTYDYQGVTIQNSCNTHQSTSVTGKFNIEDFEYNICANSLYWFNQFNNQNIMQPLLFTALAVLGAALMFIDRRRRELAAVGIWFLIFFLLYTFFYAGAVTYGVDWRFELSMLAQASILGGFGCAMVIDLVSMGNTGRQHAASHARYSYLRAHLPEIAAAVVLIALILYSFYAFIPQLGIKPINTIQAGDARFYEGFVYNESHFIPANCLVFTYDPGLFNINNRSAAQMSYLSGNKTVLGNITRNYSCQVADWGFWCYTPNNYCTSLNRSYTLTPIVNATFQQDGKLYGFYYIKAK